MLMGVCAEHHDVVTYKQLFGRSVQYVQIESAINEALAVIEPQAFLCS